MTIYDTDGTVTPYGVGLGRDDLKARSCATSVTKVFYHLRRERGGCDFTPVQRLEYILPLPRVDTDLTSPSVSVGVSLSGDVGSVTLRVRLPVGLGG